jgi:hypothetical protein
MGGATGAVYTGLDVDDPLSGAIGGTIGGGIVGSVTGKFAKGVAMGKGLKPAERTAKEAAETAEQVAQSRVDKFRDKIPGALPDADVVPATPIEQMNREWRATITGVDAPGGFAEDVKIVTPKVKGAKGTGAPELPSATLERMAARRETKQAIRRLELATERPEGFSGTLGRAGHEVGKAAQFAVVPILDALNKMGRAGQTLSEGIKIVLDNAQLKAGKTIVNELRPLGRGLTKEERKHVGRVLSGTDVPESDKIADIAAKIRQILNRVSAETRMAKVRVYDPDLDQTKAFRHRENYFPLEYSNSVAKKYLTPGTLEHKQGIDYFLKQKFAKNREEAEALLRRFLRPDTPEFRYGHLQIVRRHALPGFNEDPWEVLPQYIYRGQKRIEEARVFGATDAFKDRLITQMAEEGTGDVRYAEDGYRAFARGADRDYSNLAKLTRTWNIISLLKTAGIAQIGQWSNTIGQVGLPNFIEGLGAMFTKHGRQWGEATGAALGETIQGMMPASERGIAGHWLNLILLAPLDKINRIQAALAGRLHTQDMAAKLVKMPTHGATLREIEKLGLDPAAILERGGQLTEEELRRGALAVANNTQFRGSAAELPLMKSTPLGEFTHLFKSFAIQQTRHVGGLLKEAKQGNWKPLIQWMAATGTLTAGNGELIRMARQGMGGNVEAPDNPIIRYLEDVAIGGGFGIAYDTFKAMEGGPGRVANLLGGPAFGQLAEFLERDIADLKDGEPRTILRHALRTAPFIGSPALADWLVP